MSVVVRTAGREVLVAGDAVYLRSNLDDAAPALPHRGRRICYRRSLREIRQYVKETPDALVIPGHDWDAWQELDPAY